MIRSVENMKKFNILSDKRFDEIGVIALKNKEHKESSLRASESHTKLIEILGHSREARDLLDDFNCEIASVSAIENDIYYEQGFKDGLKFILGKEE